MALKEITAGRIDGGAMIDKLNRALEEMGQACTKNFTLFEKNDTAKGKVTLEIKIERDERLTDEYGISYQIKKSYPNEPVSRTTFAKVKKGKLVCQASGTDEGSASQESFLPDAEENEDTEHE